MAERALIAAGIAVASYLIGGIPSAFLVGRAAKGIDIRRHGSGNVGATNAFRVLGTPLGIAVAVADVLKGFVPVLIARLLAPAGWQDALMVAAAMAAVLGHTFPPFLSFRGGKGVATAAGALFVLTPLSMSVLVPVFALVILVTRMVSAGSLTVAVAYPVTVFLWYGDRPVTIVFSFAAAALVLWRHRGNIARIAKGTERRIGPAPSDAGGGGDAE